jgi:hypothetical protein
MKAFGFIHKIYKLIVMSLLSKNQTNTQNTFPISQQELNAEELEMLLLLIKESTFMGKDVEKIYNTTLKLQNQYLKQNK